MTDIEIMKREAPKDTLELFHEILLKSGAWVFSRESSISFWFYKPQAPHIAATVLVVADGKASDAPIGNLSVLGKVLRTVCDPVCILLSVVEISDWCRRALQPRNRAGGRKDYEERDQPLSVL
jgi:hypothetical protein